jgi:phage-related protein
LTRICQIWHILVVIEPKPVFFVGSSREDLRELPESVKDVFGYALYMAQRGELHVRAKPLRGFGGAGVLEIIDHDEGGTYRTVYTVRFAGAVYVLHVFQKKSRRGIATPRQEIELVRARLRQADLHYAETFGKDPGDR